MTPKVSIIVVPRERFSCTQTSLESLFANTSEPYDLTYIDAGSPKDVSDYLQTMSETYSFRLIRVDKYLPPNTARNTGLRHAPASDYTVFLDNDVIFKPGWLGSLLATAQHTGAAAVAPLTFEDEHFEIVHQWSGKFNFNNTENGLQVMTEYRPYAHKKIAQVENSISERPTQLTEFHCLLVRTDVFQQIGMLDERLLSMAEESDFCLSLLRHGYTIYSQPKSHVAYLPPSPNSLTRTDLPFFFIRWSDAWLEQSVEHFRVKHSLSPSSPCLKNYRGFVKNHRFQCSTKHGRMRNRHVITDKRTSVVDKLATLVRRRQALSVEKTAAHYTSELHTAASSPLAV
jgi:GT2 family glycosyltransferase